MVKKIEINVEEREGINKPRKPKKKEISRNGEKSKTQEKELDYIENISTILREFRYLREYTQNDLCAQTGISQQLISRIDRNDINPRLSTVKKYLEVCGVDLEQLLKDALLKAELEKNSIKK